MEEIGLESSLLDDIISGKKNVEPRLAVYKYKNLKAGDKLSLRRDIYNKGQLVRSVADTAVVEILAVFHFDSLKEMLKTVGFKRAMPGVRSINKALKIYRQFYSENDERKYGVVAFELNLLAVVKSGKEHNA